jgi:hypothetical protein
MPPLASMSTNNPSTTLLTADFLLGSFFGPVGGNDIFARNVDKLSSDYDPKKNLLDAGFLLGLFYDSEDGSNKFLQNVI